MLDEREKKKENEDNRYKKMQNYHSDHTVYRPRGPTKTRKKKRNA